MEFIIWMYLYCLMTYVTISNAPCTNTNPIEINLNQSALRSSISHHALGFIDSEDHLRCLVRNKIPIS